MVNKTRIRNEVDVYSYSNPEYHRVLKKNASFMIRNNVQLRDICWNETAKQVPDVCSEPGFLQQACARFPLLMAKVVRLRLMPVRKLLDDPQLKTLKVVYLIRDPRGTLSSRAKSWGCTNRDCIDAAQLCRDLSDDVDSFDVLNAQYPGRLLSVRYETLAGAPLTAYERIFTFARLSFPPLIRNAIANHTSVNGGDAFSTWRKADDVDRWKTTTNKTRIRQIQTACRGLLTRLGYPIYWETLDDV